MDESAETAIEFLKQLLPLIKQRFFSTDNRLKTDILETLLRDATHENGDFLRALALLSATRISEIIEGEETDDAIVMRTIRPILEKHYLNQLKGGHHTLVAEARKILSRLPPSPQKRSWNERVERKDARSFRLWMDEQEEREQKKLKKKQFTHEKDRQRLLALNNTKWRCARSAFPVPGQTPDGTLH